MATETIRTIQAALDPYVKPREQAAYVRRVLALHLDSHLDAPSVSGSGSGSSSTVGRPLLALADGPSSSSSSQHVPPGLQRDYLRALAANAAARARFEEIKRQLSSAAETTGAPPHHPGLEFAEQHAAILELRQRKTRLEILTRHMDGLAQLPAASATFLDQAEAFAGCEPLPSVPREVLEGLATGAPEGKTGADLGELISRLEKVALRSRLRLDEEEKLLRECRARMAAGAAEQVSDTARLAALNATRSELIGWIEAELGKTAESSGDDGGDGGPSGPSGNCEEEVSSMGKINEQEKTGARIAAQLAEIGTVYGRYVESRRALLAAAGSRPQPPPISADSSSPESAVVGSSSAGPSGHLVAPYLEALLAVSREQRDAISLKSHLTSSLSGQVRDTCQILGHLADESQLLPRFHGASVATASAAAAATATPAPKPAASRLRAEDRKLGAMGPSESPDLAARVRPWVSAADAAKLATLEAVAEKIEEGQVALERSMEALREVNHLLGRDPAGEAAGSAAPEPGEPGEPGEGAVAGGDGDIWLATAAAAPAGPRSRIPSRRVGPGLGKKREEQEDKRAGIWSLIDGRLGIEDPGGPKEGGG